MQNNPSNLPQPNSPPPTAILIFSNDKGMSLTLSDLLRRSGETATLAQTPEHAWACIKSGQIGVVILDLTKPSNDCFVLLRAARSCAVTMDLPFLFLTQPDFRPPVLPSIGTERVRDTWLPMSSPGETMGNMVSRLLQHLNYCRQRVRATQVNLPITPSDPLVTPPGSASTSIRVPPPGGDTADGSTRINVLSGRIDSIDVTKILGMIEPMGLTGTLKVSDTGREGDVYFVKGAVWHAKMQEIEGPDALFLLFHMKKGEFRFDVTPAVEERSIRGNTMSLLLEGLRQMDEAKRVIREHHERRPRTVPPTTSQAIA